ncbi:MAG: tRNA (adenosine(37)-N6)-dimethylallyltransferase MiaA [Alphaproteobacteria bacterium]|nr:tRNA (adenosine(37)-N6)-dimethylallyltransferase MiaA [Alphaproteobacteria bacterium]
MLEYLSSIDFLILAGPTASGKSGLAIELAERCNGEIINADSMQVYKDLSILTARPTESLIPHHLYGVLDAHQNSSAAWWIREVGLLIKNCIQRSKFPIVVGGTGLYLRTLTHGLSPVPEIEPGIRDEVRNLCQKLGGRFAAYVFEIDPLLQDRIRPSDSQRLSRALEVFRQTGCSITFWHGKSIPSHSYKYQYVIIEPDRAQLYEQINKRFQLMIECGAIEEVQNLRKLDLPADRPIMKAIGVPELSAYLENQLSLDEATQKAKQNSRNYAKRQMTWFRGQVSKKIVICSPYIDTLLKKLDEEKDKI